MKMHKVNSISYTKIVKLLLILLSILVVSFSTIANAEEIEGAWAGGSKSLFEIFEFNSDNTGCWTMVTPFTKTLLVLNGTWSRDKNTIVYTTSEAGKAPIIAGINVSFKKGHIVEFTLDGSILTETSTKNHIQLVKLP